MAKSCTLVFILLLASLGLADLKSELEKRYAAWDAAYKKHDVEALQRMLSPDFRLVTEGGERRTRKQYVASLWKSAQPSVYQTRALRVSREKSLAYAWTEEVSRFGEGEVHTHKYRDTWVLRRGRWLLRESRTLSH